MEPNASRIHMPLIGPPPAGTDGDSYYQTVAQNANLELLQESGLGLKIRLSKEVAEEHRAVFAFSAGLLAVDPQEPNAVVLKISPDSAYWLKAERPSGSSPVQLVRYKNLNTATFGTFLLPVIKKLLPEYLQEVTGEPPETDVDSLATHFLNQFSAGDVPLYVDRGTAFGEVSLVGLSEADQKYELTLLLSYEGLEVSPHLLLRAMPSYAGPEWLGHPLVGALEDFPLAVQVFAKFEVWNGESYEPLPAGTPVNLVHHRKFAADKDVATANTDDQGRASFNFQDQKHLRQLADSGQHGPNLYFNVNTAGLKVQVYGEERELPPEWSTRKWRSISGESGLAEDFNGTYLGAADAPLVFRIGFDYHVKLVYVDESKESGGTVQVDTGSTTVHGLGTVWSKELIGLLLIVNDEKAAYVIEDVVSVEELLLREAYSGSPGTKPYSIAAPAPAGVPVKLFARGIPSVHLKSSFTDDEGELHGLVWELNGGEDIFFHISFVINNNVAAGLKSFGPSWCSILAPESWETHIPDKDRWHGGVNLANTSLGSQGQPIALLCANYDRNTALYFLKILTELWTFLNRLTAGEWLGVGDLKLAPSQILLGPIPLLGSLSWPIGRVNIIPSMSWSRDGLVHEFSHQVVWKNTQFDSWPIAVNYLFGDFYLNHHPLLLTSPGHALVEGWPDAVAQIFTQVAVPYNIVGVNKVFTSISDLKHGSNPVPLLPDPVDRGESVEGAFSLVLAEIFWEHIVGAESGNIHRIQESKNGRLQGVSWLTDEAVSERFVSLIWEPLKAMSGLSEPSSTEYIETMRLLNPAVWPVVREIFHKYNMAFPLITDVKPVSGPKNGGAIISIEGVHLDDGGTLVEIGGVAVGATVKNHREIEVVAPGGPLGLVDVKVTTESGSYILVDGYEYKD